MRFRHVPPSCGFASESGRVLLRELNDPSYKRRPGHDTTPRLRVAIGTHNAQKRAAAATPCGLTAMTPFILDVSSTRKSLGRGNTSIKVLDDVHASGQADRRICSVHEGDVRGFDRRSIRGSRTAIPRTNCHQAASDLAQLRATEWGCQSARADDSCATRNGTRSCRDPGGTGKRAGDCDAGGIESR